MQIITIVQVRQVAVRKISARLGEAVERLIQRGLKCGIVLWPQLFSQPHLGLFPQRIGIPQGVKSDIRSASGPAAAVFLRRDDGDKALLLQRSRSRRVSVVGSIGEDRREIADRNAGVAPQVAQQAELLAGQPREVPSSDRPELGNAAGQLAQAKAGAGLRRPVFALISRCLVGMGFGVSAPLHIHLSALGNGRPASGSKLSRLDPPVGMQLAQPPGSPAGSSRVAKLARKTGRPRSRHRGEAGSAGLAGASSTSAISGCGEIAGASRSFAPKPPVSAGAVPISASFRNTPAVGTATPGVHQHGRQAGPSIGADSTSPMPRITRAREIEVGRHVGSGHAGGVLHAGIVERRSHYARQRAGATQRRHRTSLQSRAATGRRLVDEMAKLQAIDARSRRPPDARG